MLKTITTEVFQNLRDSATFHLTMCRVNFGDFGDSVLKLKEESAAEICAYEFAQACGVRLPEIQGFWIRESTDQNAILENRNEGIGLAVRFLDGAKHFGSNRAEAAALDPVGMARILALWAFDGHDWGELLLWEKCLYLVDLEYVVPTFGTRSFVLKTPEERNKAFDRRLKSKAGEAGGALQCASTEASALGIGKPFLTALKAACRIDLSEIDFQSALQPHPLAGEISSFARTAIRERQMVLSELLEEW